MRPIFLAVGICATLAQFAPASDPSEFDDATLRAVQFVDKQEGWCVGDRGVICHSIDGGKTWERQPTGLRASLRSLQFRGPYVGWVVGREELPNGNGSVGVFLFTRDGGLKWTQVHRNTLPGLNQVNFIDDKTGFVAGDGTDQYPSGVFSTRDGGKSWQPLPGPHCPGWRAVSFQNGTTGVLVGNWDRLATLRDGILGAANVDSLEGRSLLGLSVEGKHAVAVGQGGLILVSDTGGERWGVADLKLASDVRADWDFQAIHTQGRHCWVVGRPGSVVLYSGDHGNTWEVRNTGQPLPLHGVFFRDEQNGWAVGAFGSVLATVDGGLNWTVQRRGGQRAALLCLHARGAGVPLDSVALVGGQEGYLITAVRTFAPDPKSASFQHAADGDRLAAATEKAGGATGELLWQFPVPQHLAQAGKEDLLRHWDHMHNDRAAEQLLRQLVLTLRTWRPSVIVTDHPDAAAKDGAATDALLAEALHEAFLRAADPKAFPEQIQVLGLEPWRAEKLYGRWHESNGAQVVQDMNEIGTRLLASYHDHATPAAALLVEGECRLPPQRCYRLLDSKMEGAQHQRELMEGVSLAPGGSARREATPPTPLGEAALKNARERRNLQVIADTPPGALTDPEKLLAGIGPALAKMPDEQASAAAFALAERYASMGQWTLAREIYLLLVDHYPAHPQAADAYRWLIRYNSSSEARRRHELGQFLVVANFGFQPGTSPAKFEGDHVKVTAKGANPEAYGERSLGILSNRSETRLWNQGCLDIGSRLAAFGPVFATDPSIHLCLNAARRNLGKFDEAKDWYVRFRNEHADGPWRDAAAAELWLSNRSGPPPKAVAACRQTSSRPFLDGEFDDACWQNLKPILLRDAVGSTTKDHGTEVRLAYDKEFLYVSLRCQHPEGKFVPPVKGRQRDTDLRSFDRVSLLLDLDRDYATYFRLDVDQRGCVHDDCWGDRTWNPRWFVAVKSDPTSWRIEAAIPMIELTGDTVTVGKAWACNLVRVIPGRGVQALSLPADAEPRPEGMGLLMFTPETTPKAPMLHAN